MGRAKQRARRHPAAQADLHGLRAFRSGDSPRWVHWPTTARRGELMVREFEEMPTDSLVLVLDPTQPEQWLVGGRQSEVGGQMSAAKNGPRARKGRPSDANDGRPVTADLRLEDAVSLAATIVWEWCRQAGDQLVLAVAGPAPVVLAGTTSAALARQMLECLAGVAGCPPSGAAALRQRLAGVRLPAAPVLVVSARPTDLGDQLIEDLRRPVACIDVSSPTVNDFFERAGSHAP
jgi:uncharacterized protein (DUF58 family)